MARPRLEVADIFRAHGAAWRKANSGHVSLAQLKVMSAIEACRTAALGGHVERCEGCAHTRVAYNSCRNRHCPKCQAVAARQWLVDRQAELLPAPYYHVVFTLPATLGALAFHNKAAVYDLLFRAAAETLSTIAADPRHLGAQIGVTAVLHTWGSALTHHPHVHVIVPSGGVSLDGSRWIACKPGFFLPVRVLSRLFRRLFLEGLAALNEAGRLLFFGELASLADRKTFAATLARLSRCEWVVYAKRPFAGPKAVLAYLSRYTHRVAIANSRLIALEDKCVTFKWKDYRIKSGDPRKTMTLAVHEFIRRFLLHVLPSGFHRIRHSACSRVRGGPQTSLACANSLPQRSRRRCRTGAPLPPAKATRPWSARPVPAAAVACASSKSLRAAPNPALSPPSPSGPIRHEHRCDPPPLRRFFADDRFHRRLRARVNVRRRNRSCRQSCLCTAVRSRLRVSKRARRYPSWRH